MSERLGEKRTDTPLTDVTRRRQQVLQILDDPTLFPATFNGWLPRYVGANLTLPISAIVGLKAKLDTIPALRARVEELERRVSSLQGDNL